MSSRDELNVVLAEMKGSTGSPLRGHPGLPLGTTSRPPFHLRLAAWAVDIAAELHDRFGDVLVLTVGALPYPPRGASDLPQRQLQRCDEIALDPDEVSVTLASEVEIESGHDWWGELIVANRTASPLEIRTNGQVTARIVNAESGSLVGCSADGQRQPLIRFRAEAGGTVRVPLLIGTASFEPSLGYTVPPGQWAMEVVLDLGERGRRRAPWLPLTIIPPRRATR